MSPILVAVGRKNLGPKVQQVLEEAKTFADLYKPSPVSKAATKSVFATTTNPLLRISRASDFTNVYPHAAYPYKTCVHHLSCLTICGDAIVGVLGDLTGTCRTVEVPHDKHFEHFVCITGETEANQHQLPHIPRNILKPEDLPPPPTSDDADATDEDNSSPRPKADLKWTPLREGDLPVIAVLPLACPIEKGYRAPGTHTFTKGIPTDQKLPEYYVTWFHAVRHLMTQNNARSLHHPESILIDPNEVCEDRLGTFNLADTLKAPVTSIDAVNDHQKHKTAEWNMADIVNQLAIEKAQDLPDTPTTETPTAPPQPLDLFRVLRDSLKDTPDRTSDTEAAINKTALAKLRLLMAHPHPTNPKILSIPTEGAVLRLLMEATTPRQAARAVRDPINIRLDQAANSECALLKDTSITPRLFDVALCAALCDADFLGTPLDNANALGKSISLLLFGSVRSNSTDYQDRQRNDDAAECEDRSGIDAKNAKAPKSTLFYSTRINTHKQVLQFFSNILFFFRCLDATLDESIERNTDNGKYNFPLAWTEIFLPYRKLIRTKQGEDYAQHGRDVKGLWYHTINELHTAWCAVVKFASDQRNQQDLLDGHDISSEAFQAVRLLVNNGIADTYRKIWNLTPPTTTPVIYWLCNPDQRPPAKRPANDAFTTPPTARPRPNHHDTNRGNSRGPPRDLPRPNNPHHPFNPSPPGARAPAATPTTAGSTPSPNKNEGMLKWTKPGTPIPDGLAPFDHPNKPGTTIRICKNGSIKGLECKHGPNCRFFHFLKRSDVPNPLFQDIARWVARTDGLEFAPTG